MIGVPHIDIEEEDGPGARNDRESTGNQFSFKAGSTMNSTQMQLAQHKTEGRKSSKQT